MLFYPGVEHLRSSSILVITEVLSPSRDLVPVAKRNVLDDVPSEESPPHTERRHANREDGGTNHHHEYGR